MGILKELSCDIAFGFGQQRLLLLEKVGLVSNLDLDALSRLCFELAVY